ncbi:hypothetical protein A2382_03340 [Candidatus Woesebacteria bacterium RIFOXYB1_FULL_38_16]|uniref:Uncharacterized protein n=1 Tax=Candidatus Woesebacteria bacterium RIFOXYB1_FULL_38_16 TaxID=1802538 RepID=A0A1F8CRJ3_9BACT|nr:MAG: hypothetical protein A2382_03340 [Candidatus Woesebacteria bacterium RIFOXYB1_FULL_38_16]
MKKKIQQGYIAIASVLVISAVVLTIGTTVSLLSVNDIQSALAGKKGEESLDWVEGCVEDALIRLNETNSIPATLSVLGETCSVTINSHSGHNWTFTVEKEVNGYLKKVQVSAIWGLTVEIVSWNEI